MDAGNYGRGKSWAKGHLLQLLFASSHRSPGLDLQPTSGGFPCFLYEVTQRYSFLFFCFFFLPLVLLLFLLLLSTFASYIVPFPQLVLIGFDCLLSCSSRSSLIHHTFYDFSMLLLPAVRVVSRDAQQQTMTGDRLNQNSLRGAALGDKPPV